MSLLSRLTESRGLLATFVFYTVAGVILLVLLPLTTYPPELAAVGIFSLVAAYGLFQKRSWAIWFVIVLFFAATAFSITMIYLVNAVDPLATISSTAYLVLTWIFTAYVATRRSSLES